MASEYQPIPSHPSIEADPLDPRVVRPKGHREPRLVPWSGCPLFPAQEVPQIPAGAQLCIVLCLLCDGEEVPFERSPLKTSLKAENIRARWGPWMYVAHLHVVDPSAPGGLGQRIASKELVIRSRDADDVGTEPWPIDLEKPEIPRTLHMEVERRAEIRGEVSGDGGGYDPQTSAGRGYDARGYEPQAYGARGYGGRGGDRSRGGRRPLPMDAGGYEVDPGEGYDGEDEEDDDMPRRRPPSGFMWARVRGVWALVEGDGEDDPLASRRGAGTGRGRPGGGMLAAFLERPPEEVLAIVAGGAKLLKEFLGTGNRDTSADDRIRAEMELRKHEATLAHDAHLKNLEAQQALARPAPAPQVDVQEIRRQALNEARLEALHNETLRLRQELERAGTQKPASGGGDIVSEFKRIRAEAEALGILKQAGGPQTPPTTLEQIADLLSTPGGTQIATMALGKMLGTEPPQAPSLPAQAGETAHAAHPAQDGDGYSVTGPLQ